MFLQNMEKLLPSEQIHISHSKMLGAKQIKANVLMRSGALPGVS
jgi:hypothetical protein